MSDETLRNSPGFVAHHQGDEEAVILARENTELRKALAALQANVVTGQFKGEMPRYQLNEPGFYDDTYFERGSVIDFTDPPNLSMVPMNEPAKRAMQAEIERQTDGARAKAAQSGRQFFGLMTDRNVLIDTAMADAKAQAAVPPPEIKMPTPLGDVPAMPHMAEAQAAARRGPGRPRKAMAVPQAPRVGPEANRPMAGPAPAETVLPPAVVGRRVA